MNTYYFTATFYDEEYQRRKEFGFVQADSYVEAMSQIHGRYRDDLMSVSIEGITDCDMLVISDELLARQVRKAAIINAYGEDANVEENV